MILLCLVSSSVASEHSALLTNAISKTSSSSDSGPSYIVDFLSTTRHTVHTKRKTESQLCNTMAATLKQFSVKEFVWILVVDLPATVLRSLAVALDLRSSVGENREEVALVIER